MSTGSAARALAAALVALGLVTGAAAAEKPVRIVFPEGFSSRQLVDRVAEVHAHAKRKRGVTPVPTGAAYRKAVARASPPAFFTADEAELCANALELGYRGC